jgi:hypothetical protein
MNRADAIELLQQNVWRAVCKLEPLDNADLAVQVRGLAEAHERLGQVVLRATAAHYTAMAAELKERVS